LLSLATLLVLGAEAASPQEDALMQTWDEALDGNKQDTSSSSSSTPISRVVKLLQEMSGTMKKEMDEDEELYDKLKCWCNNNAYEKNQAIDAAEAKIAELTSTIDQLTAKSSELKITIEKTATELEADKTALAEATETRNKELKEVQGTELDAIQNIENLKSAIMVLGRHHGAFPQISLLGFRSHRKGTNPFGSEHEGRLDRQFDDFMAKNDYDAGHHDTPGTQTDRAVQKFLQDQSAPQEQAAEVPSQHAGWTAEEKAIVQHALHSATNFLQAQGRQTEASLYAPASGEILGVLKQLKDEMTADLSDAQKTEMA